jgi:ADP-heptose:LPS heptosyltransferase
MRSPFHYVPYDAVDLTKLNEIVVFQRKNLGDAALTLPLIHALVGQSENVHIHMMCSKSAVTLFQGIEKVSVSMTFGWRDAMRIRDADLCIDLHGFFKFRFIANMFRTLIVGFDCDRGNVRLLSHVVSVPKLSFRKKLLQNLDVIRRLGYQPDVLACLEATKTSLVRAGEASITMPQRYVVIHPGARWMFKTLSEQQWLTIIGHIRDNSGYEVVITGGSSDMEIELGKALENIAGVTNLVGKTSVSELLGVLSKAAGYLGVDTFTSHLASFLGVPGTVVFGPSDSRIWGPLESSSLMVFHLHGNDWNCIPCNLDGCGGGKASQCLLQIQPEQLLALFMRVIGESNDQAC